MTSFPYIMSWEKALHNCRVNELESISDKYIKHKRIPLPPPLVFIIHTNLFPEQTMARYKIGCNCFILLLAVQCLHMKKRKKNALIFSPWPLIRYRKKIRSHCFPESFLVLFGRNNGGGSILWAPKYAWCFNPCLQMLVPSILSHVINNPYNQLLALIVHPHQQRVVHHINRLSKRTKEIDDFIYKFGVWEHNCL